MLDKNKNGEIDKTEQEEAMKNIHSMTLPKARWAWSAMDTDGDGKISEKEFQEGMQAIADKVEEEQLVDSIIRAWTDHPLALEKAKKEREVFLAAVTHWDPSLDRKGRATKPHTKRPIPGNMGQNVSRNDPSPEIRGKPSQNVGSAGWWVGSYLSKCYVSNTVAISSQARVRRCRNARIPVAASRPKASAPAAGLAGPGRTGRSARPRSRS